MNRNKLALGLMLGVCITIAAPDVASAAEVATTAAAVDQDRWVERKKTLTLPNGLKMAYVDAGDPNGEPLLLLHGFTDTSRSWSLVVPHLARYRLLIPDQRGHGASDAPACCYSPAALAEDARLFLDALGVRRAAVAGHSMGSMVGISLAAEHPERVSDLILIGSTGKAAVQRGDWLFENVMALKAPLDPNSQFMRDWAPSNQPTPVDTAFASAAMPEILDIPLHVWRGVIRELVGLPIARHAADVEARTLILSGGKDPLFAPDHHAALVDAFPGAEAHVFPGLGHNFHWEQPIEVARRIESFLSGKLQAMTSARK